MSKKNSSNFHIEINDSITDEQNEDSSEFYESISSQSKKKQSYEEISIKEEDVKVNINNNSNNTNTNNNINIESNENKKDELIEQLILSNQQTIQTIKQQSDEKIVKLEQKINELITNNNSLKQKVKNLETEKNDNINFNKLLIRNDDENQKPKNIVPKFQNGRGFPPSKIRKRNLIKKQSLSQVQSHTIDEPMFGLQSNDFKLKKKIKSQEKKKNY